MKYKLLILIALTVLLSGCLESPSGTSDAHDAKKKLIFGTELKPALKAAKEQNKPLFLYFRSDFCGYCRLFESETLSNKSVIKKLNEDFIMVSIDVYRQKNETMMFRVFGTPSLVFLNSEGTEIKRIPGYIDTDTFLRIINQIA